MNSFFRRRVYLSEAAYRQIESAVAATEDRWEVGGLLLGHWRLRRFDVVAVTVAAEDAERSGIAFTLDGARQTAAAAERMRKFRRKPSVLGVWHSHTCGLSSFSEQDRVSNRQLAAVLGGALSVLAVTEPTTGLQLHTWFVAADGTESCCRAEADIHGQKIPRRYMEKI